jgi:hypothetical protein
VSHTPRTAPVVLRHEVELPDPLAVALEFLEAYAHLEPDAPDASSFDESDIRRANRGGARIAATQAAAIVERRRAIERALRAIAPDASLAAAAGTVPWPQLGRLFDAFADIHGVGFSKMTKALHPKRPALIPILDSLVQEYLADDDPGAGAPFGARAVALVRGYKRDLDRNRGSLRAIRAELTRQGYRLTETRVLDILIWSVGAGSATPAKRP